MAGLEQPRRKHEPVAGSAGAPRYLGDGATGALHPRAPDLHSHQRAAGALAAHATGKHYPGRPLLR